MRRKDQTKNYKVNARGVLDADIHTKGQSGSVEFTVTLSGESQFDVTVDYQTTDDSAAAGSDSGKN